MRGSRDDAVPVRDVSGISISGGMLSQIRRKAFMVDLSRCRRAGAFPHYAFDPREAGAPPTLGEGTG